MREKINTIFKAQTFQQSIFTSISTIINGLLGLAFYPLVARLTNISDFGAFSICILTITLLSDIANVGTDTGIVRFVGKYIHHDTTRAFQYLKFGLKIKLAAIVVVLIVGLVSVEFIASQLLHKPELTKPLAIGIFGSATLLLFSFTTSAIQAMQRFKLWSGLIISLNTLRLFGILLIALTGSLTIDSALSVYAFTPLLGFVVGIILLPSFWKVKKENAIAKEFLHYNKWVAAFILIAAVSSRLDSFLVTRHLPLDQVGIYSAAVTLTSVVPQVVSAIATVVAPKLASFTNKVEFLIFFKKLQIFLLSLAFFGVVLGIFIGAFLLPTLYGSEFIASISPFAVLLVSQGIFLVSVPVHTTVLYYYSKPQVFVWVSAIHLVIIFFLGNLLISQYGTLGAAITVLVGNIANLLLPTVWVVRKVRNDYS